MSNIFKKPKPEPELKTFLRKTPPVPSSNRGSNTAQQGIEKPKEVVQQEEPSKVGLPDELIGTSKDKKPDTPHELRIPTYLMNFPFTMDNRNQNNVWMKDGKNSKPINYDVEFSQWTQLYNFIASDAIVYILPSAGNFQDLEYVANLGIVLTHLDKPTAILSKFTSPPRQGEEYVGLPFFRLMKYDTQMCPYRWEGEAELKWLHDNIYIGGTGERSEQKAYDWMSEKFNMQIISVEERDDKLYHLDCSIFPITQDKTLVCTEIFTPEEIKQIESVTEIIPVGLEDAHNGITNCVRVNNMICCASSLSTMKTSDKEYRAARETVEHLTDICVANAMEPVFFNLSEGEKSGAALSCNIAHLNHQSYMDDLV